MNDRARFAWLVLPEAERSAFLAGVAPKVTAEEYERIRGMIEAFPELAGLVDRRDLSLGRLRRMLFGASTEKTSTVCPPPQDPEVPRKEKRPRRGHGRHGAQAYTGAERIAVPHPQLQPGDLCADCQEGTLRDVCRPSRVLRLQAQAPITATVHELQVLRCNLCGKTFTAPCPPEAGAEKYDPSVGVMVGMLRYGAGVPHYRLAQWQQSLGVPLPASTQWELVEEVARVIQPVTQVLIRQAAQAPTLFNDDTTMRVGALRQEIQAEDKPARTGLFTTGIMAQRPDHPVALFFTGRQHAGENLADVLAHRDPLLPTPLQMCDGLSRNPPKTVPTILGCCLAHGRRGFVEVATRFPQECRQVLETLRGVYQTDAEAKAQGLSPEQRLVFHQTQSQPLMDQLHTWMEQQLAHKKVEPNSGLGDAIEYMLGHWTQLTRFLHVPGAPLDNNIVERLLKTAILHRKNSLSYKTEHGAEVGDWFMSLIQTCRLNHVHPFDYFLALARHPAQVAAHPERWLPWNYRDTLDALATPSTPDTG